MDHYSPCFCGTGKKVKFCCPDLLSDFEKIERMLEGQQRIACLDHLDQLDEKFQDRASVMALRTLLHSEMGEPEKTEAALIAFLAKHPDNPIALAESSVFLAGKGNPAAAVQSLEKAFAATESISMRVYESIGALGQILFSTGHVFAGRALISMQTAISSDDERPASMLMQLNADANVPLLFKDDPQLKDCPADAPFQQEFEESMAFTAQGAWVAAAERFATLSEEHPNEPSIVNNLATLYCFTADPRAAETLRQYARLDVPLDDAVESWARAAIVSPEHEQELVDLVRVSIPIDDLDSLHQKMLADDRMSKMPVDLNRLVQENQPPPRDAFWLLDRPASKNGAEITRDDVPCVLAEVLVYGKQTDREARIELALGREEIELAIKALAAVTGDGLDTTAEPELIAQAPMVARALQSRWRLPNDMPSQVRDQLMVEQQRHLLLNNWVNLPQKQFGNSSPADASTNFEYRIPLLAAILQLQYGEENSWIGFDFNELRSTLNLPTADEIRSEQIEVARITLTQLARMRPDSLSDDDLLKLYALAIMHRADTAAEWLGLEVTTRESIAKNMDIANIFGQIAERCASPDRAFEYLAKAREIAEAAGKSPAVWYLRELPLRIIRQDTEQVQSLMSTLQTYWNEPGIADGVVNVLSQFGIIDPAQVAAAGGMGPAPGMPAAAGPAPPAAAPSSGLWTPGGGAAPPAAAPPAAAPPAAGGEKKSSLWMPGMD